LLRDDLVVCTAPKNGEAKDEDGREEDEECQVEDVEDCADDLKARELIRRLVSEEAEDASIHTTCEPVDEESVLIGGNGYGDYRLPYWSEVLDKSAECAPAERKSCFVVFWVGFVLVVIAGFYVVGMIVYFFRHGK